MGELKSLRQHETERETAYRSRESSMLPHHNGIACPQCGAELMDSNPSVTLMSYPPKKAIHCEGCEYRGYRTL